MIVHQEILDLLNKILNNECSPPFLAQWLAENSLQFLESPNSVDSMIIADLDAALGEIQRGTNGNELLYIVATQLVQGLRLPLPPKRKVKIT